MAKYLKPQTPLQHQSGDYIYPLTTSDQVIIDKDNRLNSLFKKTIKEIATCKVAGWSDTKPYTQTITLNHSVDDYDVDANVAYGDEDNAALHAAAGCLSYIKKNNNTITFYCLKKKPDIDIPVEISGTCRNTIATIEEGVKLNFDILAYATEEEMLADTPAENTIGVITDVEITGYKFSATEPEDINEGEVWICIGSDSDVAFDIVDDVTVYPLSVKQHIGGTWVDKEAKIYLREQWLMLGRHYIFKEGEGVSENFNTWLEKTSSTASITSDYIYIHMTDEPSGSVTVVSKNQIDVTEYNKMCIDMTAGYVKSGTYARYFGLSKNPINNSYKAPTWASSKGLTTNYDRTVYELDISSLSGEYYVWVAWGVSADTYIYNVWFE